VSFDGAIERVHLVADHVEIGHAEVEAEPNPIAEIESPFEQIETGIEPVSSAVELRNEIGAYLSVKGHRLAIPLLLRLSSANALASSEVGAFCFTWCHSAAG
jgi:hypothetical protein